MAAEIVSVDVLFIHPGNQKGIYQDLAGQFTAIATPAWTMLLANYVRNQGYSTAIYDVHIEGWDESVPKALVEKYNPNLIVVMVYGHNPSASTQTMPAARTIVKDIKGFNSDIPIATGGIHPSALPERTLREEGVDFVIQGEGPYTIAGLIEYLSGKKRVEDVEGLWYWRDGRVRSAPRAPVVADLDAELDGYAWDLLPSLDHYRAHNMHCFQDFEKSQREDFSDVRSPYVAMNTSLGCPYSCHYCCINAIFGKPGIRYWSLEKVLSWIDTLVTEHNVRNIRFDDELFILSPKRIERFCDMLAERNYDLNIMVYGRVDTTRDSLLGKLKRAGVNWICLGIESGNERVRNDVNKTIRRDIKEVVRLIQAHDIYVLGNYMFGLPQDDLSTMQETLDLAIDLNCEFANMYTVMAFPGSGLYEWASDQGSVPDNWSAFSQHSYDTQPIPTRYLLPAEVLAFRDKAFHTCFSNDDYLRMVENRFGGKVREHIEKMLTIRLERKLAPVNET